MKLRLDNVVIQQGMYALNLFFTHRLNFLKNTIMYGVTGGGGAAVMPVLMESTKG